MTLRTSLCVLASAVAVCATGSAYAGGVNLIQNGSFEDPVISFPWYQDFGANTGDPHWTNATIPDWTITTNNVDIVSDLSSTPKAADGDQYLDLVGTGSTGGIETSQTFATIAGQQYSLSFDYGNNPWSTSTASALIQVSVGGLTANITHNSSTQLNINWTPFSETFVGTGSPMTLSFDNTVGGGSGGVLLDDIAITATPVPPALALFGGGLGLISLIAKRKRRRRQNAHRLNVSV